MSSRAPGSGPNQIIKFCSAAPKRFKRLRRRQRPCRRPSRRRASMHEAPRRARPCTRSAKRQKDVSTHRVTCQVSAWPDPERKTRRAHTTMHTTPQRSIANAQRSIAKHTRPYNARAPALIHPAPARASALGLLLLEFYWHRGRGEISLTYSQNDASCGLKFHARVRI